MGIFACVCMFTSVITAIKASVLSAHDKGSHAVVLVKVRKVLHSGKVPVSLGTRSIYPVSWTSRGCTCPVLNPGKSLWKPLLRNHLETTKMRYLLVDKLTSEHTVKEKNTCGSFIESMPEIKL